ncbi:MAG: Holliday junction branch migration protein RuvA, partial [Christensenellaceae bacterium]
MIAYLKGNVLHINPEYAIIETGGVGYEVFLSGSAYRSLIGKRTGEVYTYYQLKEDGVSLFGFSSLQEKALFLELISVSGVGPKMGIAVLVQLSAEEAIAAISTANLKKLCSVKGLGKKTAERIV